MNGSSDSIRSLFSDDEDEDEIAAAEYLSMHESEKQLGIKFTDEEKQTIQFGSFIGENPELTLKKVLAKRANPDSSYYELQSLVQKKRSESLPDKVIIYKSTEAGIVEEETIITKASNVVGIDKGAKIQTKLRSPRLPGTPGLPSQLSDSENTSSRQNVLPPPIRTGLEKKFELDKIVRDIRKRSQSGDASPSPGVSGEGKQTNSLLRRPARSTSASFGLPPPEVPDSKDEDFEFSELDGMIDNVRDGFAQPKKVLPKTFLRKPVVRKNVVDELREDSDGNSNPVNDDKEIPDEVKVTSELGIESARSPAVGESVSDLERLIDGVSYGTSQKRKTLPKELIRKPAKSVESSMEVPHSELEVNSSANSEDTLEMLTNDSAQANQVEANERIEADTQNDVDSEKTKSKIPVRQTADSFLRRPNFDPRPAALNREEGDSKESAFFNDTWKIVVDLEKTQNFVEVDIVGANESGVYVSFLDLQGFVPARELSKNRWTGIRLKSEKVDEEVMGMDNESENEESDEINFGKSRKKFLESLVGKRASVRVLKYDRRRQNIVFSEKSRGMSEEDKLELQQSREKIAAVMDKLQLGEIVRVKVKTVVNFGAFVHIDGVEALIHISELSWGKVALPSDVVQVGQELDAKVVGLDTKRYRINLSLKKLTPDPLLSSLDELVESSSAQEEASLEFVSNKALEMPEVLAVVKSLEECPQITKVSYGRRLRGPAIAPVFQIYLSSKLEDGYKLLARMGTEVQEILVVSSMDREEMKQVVQAAVVEI